MLPSGPYAPRRVDVDLATARPAEPRAAPVGFVAVIEHERVGALGHPHLGTRRAEADVAADRVLFPLLQDEENSRGRDTVRPVERESVALRSRAVGITLVLVVEGGRVVSVPLEEVEARGAEESGLPGGLAGDLTLEQFADLVGYLATLKRAARPAE